MIRRGYLAHDEQFFVRKMAPSTPPIVAELRAAPNNANGDRVLVVGAGMAGLTAAHELERLGFAVTVLEADASHIGGRARTLRFRSGGYGEAGAMRIPTGHDLTRFYIAEMNLQLRRFTQTNDDGFVLIRGRRERMKNAVDLLEQFALQPAEQKLGDLGMWASAVQRIANSLTAQERIDLYADRPSTANVCSLDARSLWSILSEASLSPEAIQLLASLWSLETTLHTAFTEILREEIEGTWANGFDEIVGGTDRLPGALAATLQRPVHAGCIVRRVVHTDRDVTVIYDDPAGAVASMTADWLLCTIPLGPLQRVEFTPALSPGKCDAIRRVFYDSSTKVLAQASRRFWEADDNIFGGGSVSDGILGSTWYPSDNAEAKDTAVSSASAVFLASYTWGQSALRMARPQTQAQVVPQLAGIHDALRADPRLIVGLTTWSWDAHPWSAGAYAYYRPGDQTELQAALMAAEGRVLLAGEHASMTHSWMQGAIASGLRAASYIARS